VCWFDFLAFAQEVSFPFSLCAPCFRPAVSSAKARRIFSFPSCVLRCAGSWFDLVLSLLPSQSKSFFLCCFAALTLGFVLGLDSAVSLVFVAISDLCLGEHPCPTLISVQDFFSRSLVFPAESGARSSVCAQIQLPFSVFLSEFFSLPELGRLVRTSGVSCRVSRPSTLGSHSTPEWFDFPLVPVSWSPSFSLPQIRSPRSPSLLGSSCHFSSVEASRFSL
jgi:hypothetical protein